MNQIPRGLRNNNPLNIRVSPKNRWKGACTQQSDPAFVQFESMSWGIRAAYIIIRSYYRSCPAITPREILQRWAPASENNTAAYARAVAVITGFDLDKPIAFTDRRSMAVLLRAMALVECGSRYACQLEYKLFLSSYDII